MCSTTTLNTAFKYSQNFKLFALFNTTHLTWRCSQNFSAIPETTYTEGERREGRSVGLNVLGGEFVTGSLTGLEEPYRAVYLEVGS